MCKRDCKFNISGQCHHAIVIKYFDHTLTNCFYYFKDDLTSDNKPTNISTGQGECGN